MLLSTSDIAAIATLWLCLAELGYPVQDLDLSEPGFIQHIGPHVTYSFAIKVKAGEVFPREDFFALLDRYAAVSPTVKLHAYSVEEYPTSPSLSFYPEEGIAKTNTYIDHDRMVYITVFC